MALPTRGIGDISDKDGENLTKTITITKEIEEEMRSILACALDTGEYDGTCECYHQAAVEILEDIAEYKREEYAEVNELLKALNMEPIEVPDHYTEGYQQRQEEARELRRQQYALENPPVHTCKPSYRMQQARIISAMKRARND